MGEDLWRRATAPSAIGESEVPSAAETSLERVISLLQTIVEVCGAVVIMTGAAWAFFLFIRAVVSRRRGSREFARVRLALGSFISLGLEFQLASDVLRTAIAPSFRQLGELAAIAAIRTALNYFLSKELAEDRRQMTEEDTGGRGSAESGRPRA
jgi:uncharacterized membrane protein